jgi:CRISPR-associated protein Csy2
LYVDKPASGWLVPITTGFKAISPLYEPGEVANTRDPSVPFRFVESVYSVGQWLSPHRIRDINSIFWRYHQQDDWYLCKNSYQPETETL